MPRPASPWAWRRALRDHGPDDRSLLLTLLVVSTWMNRAGSCFPNQRTIAKATRMSERTVRRQMREAESLGWVGREFMHRGGHASRNHLYRACVPDHVSLDDRDEEVSDLLEAQDGRIESPQRPDTQVSAPAQRPASIVAAPSEGADTQMSAPDIGAPCGSSTTGQPAPEHAAKSDERPAIRSNDRPPGWPPNSSLLTPHPNTHKSEAHAEARAPGTRDKHARRKNPGPEPEAERERKALVMLTALPDATDQQLKIFDLPSTRIAELRKRASIQTTEGICP